MIFCSNHQKAYSQFSSPL